jgi:L-fuculose-phosphate aldolase
MNYQNSLSDSYLSLKMHLALACKILVMEKLDSGPFGNVSLRVKETNEFFVNPEGITFDQMKPKDAVRMNSNAEVLEGKLRPHPGEVIHREIYRLRDDVSAIVHTHSEATVAISLLGCEIEPFTQLGAALFGDQAIYMGFTGPVRTSSEGAAIAQALGNKSIVIAKNHGLFAVGKTIEDALWDMVIADMAAKVHIKAKHLGINKAEKLSLEYMEKSRKEVRNKQSQQMWSSWINRCFAERY